jgi:hypothetical protein
MAFQLNKFKVSKKLNIDIIHIKKKQESKRNYIVNQIDRSKSKKKYE